MQNKIRHYVIARIFFSSSIYDKRRRRKRRRWLENMYLKIHDIKLENGDNILSRPRGKIHGREKEFGWNSAV